MRAVVVSLGCAVLFGLASCAAARSGEGKSSALQRPRYAITVTHGGTPMGEIVVELFPEVAPLHVANFDSLVRIGFYDGTAFHRVVPGFVIQGGDPNSKDKPRETWGYGDPSQRRIPAEFNDRPHKRGTVSAARAADPNSATSQFFICLVDLPQLDGKYTVFGQVVSGMEVVDAIAAVPRDARDNPLQKVEMRIRRLQP